MPKKQGKVPWLSPMAVPELLLVPLKKGKKVIAVPRLAKYGEHVDDHQIQMIEQFNEMDIICACMDTEQLADSIRFTNEHTFRSYESNTHNIIASISEYLETL